MNITSEIALFAKEIDKAIQKTLLQWQKETKQIHPQLLPLVTALGDACKGGKRVRGFLVKTGYDLFSGKKNNDIVTIAAAIEILHTAILAHDDIIDESSLRRGVSTLYKKFGTAKTISLGDVGLFLALKMLYTTSFSSELMTKAVSCLFSSLEKTMFGQLLDTTLAKKTFQIKEEDIERIHYLKTAQYTIVAPLQIGAILAGAQESSVKKIAAFGEKAGIAFQIQDDILGVFGEEKAIGKSVYSDSEEGKSTLLIIHALQKGTKQQQEFLKTHYGTQRIHKTVFAKIKDIFIATGSLQYSEEKMEAYKTQAIEAIPGITTDEKEKKMLYALLNFITERKS